MPGFLRAAMLSFAIVVAGGCKPAASLSGKWTGTAEHAGAAAAVTVEMSEAGSGRIRITPDDSGIFDFPGVLRESGARVDGEIRRGDEIIRLHGQRSGDSIEGTATLHDFVAHVHLQRTGSASPPRFSEIPERGLAASRGGHDPHPVAESESTMRSALALAGNRELLVVTQPGEPWQWPRLAPHFIDEMLQWTSARVKRLSAQ